MCHNMRQSLICGHKYVILGIPDSAMDAVIPALAKKYEYNGQVINKRRVCWTQGSEAAGLHAVYAIYEPKMSCTSDKLCN